MRRRAHRCDPYIEQIAEFLALGKSYNYISDQLADNYEIYIEEGELCVFCRNRKLRSRITHGLHKDKVPHCLNCKHYKEVKTDHITHRQSEVRVCTACMEVIPQRTVTSPEFCPKRVVTMDEAKGLV